MAENKTLYTRLVLRNDSTAGWLASKDQILLKGEIGVEFNPSAETTDKKVRIKIGDGVTTWENLPYFGGEVAHVYETTVAKEGDHIAAITTALNGAAPNTHDIAIVKEAILAAELVTEERPQKYQYTAYRWNGEAWAACDGNYNASNVYFDTDFVFTEKVGTVQTLTNGSATVAAAGKSVKDFFSGLFAKEANPKRTANASVSWTAEPKGTLEVGTKVSPSYNAKFNAGSYTYGPATGLTATSWDIDIADLSDANKSTNSGTFSEFTVKDGMKGYAKITAKATHGDGAIPKTNIGNNYDADGSKSVRIMAGTKSATSAGYTAYRAWFYGYKNGTNKLDVSAIGSDNIRALTSANGTFTRSMATNKMQQMFFACPTGKVTYTLKDDGETVATGFTVADATNGAPQTVKVKTVYVKGANNYVVSDSDITTTNTANGYKYDLFYVSNGNANSGDATYNITY